MLFVERIISLLDPSPLHTTFLIQVLLYTSFTLSPIIIELRSASLFPSSKSTPALPNTSS